MKIMFCICLFLLQGVENLNAETRDDSELLRAVIAEISALKAAYTELERKLETKQKQFEEELEKQNRVITYLQSLSGSDRSVRQLPNAAGIAFTAYLSQHATNLGHQSIVPFDAVILNEGNAFNTGSHKFVCPLTGIYNFQTALLCQINGFAITEIVKEGVQLVQAHTEGGKAGTVASGYDQGFNSVVTLCRQGEEVWVRNFQHYSSEIYGGQKYTTFTGYLLWETESVVVG